MTKRSLVEVKARCSLVLKDKEVISLVKETDTPTSAYEVVFAVTKNPHTANAARWLAIMRRDYLEDFNKIIS